MCCLFGFLDYSGKENKEKNALVNSLAQEATVRGMDSTGIAYNRDNKLTIYKKPKSAYELDFMGVEKSVCVTGHTRHATQGSEKRNYNNHPFMGFCDNTKFALSHNGILYNDFRLQKEYNLPETRIETDSYVAVQLLEYLGDLNVDNIRKMSEAVSGSFAFTMVDTDDTLYLVKGDSPLSIVHLPKQKMYVYASTDNILFKGIADTDFVKDIVNGDFKQVCIKSGEIVRIFKNGTIVRDSFKMDYSYGYNFNSWRYSGLHNYSYNLDDDYGYSDYGYGYDYEAEYISDLKDIATSMGFDPSEVDELLEAGFTLEEVEDYLYDIDSYKVVKVS